MSLLPQSGYRIFLSSLKVTFCPFAVSHIFTLSPRKHLSSLSLYKLVSFVNKFHINGIIEYVLFCIWCFFLSAWCCEDRLCILCSWFLLLNGSLLYLLVYHNLLTISPIYGDWVDYRLGLFLIKLLWIFIHECLYKHVFSFLLGDT